MHLRAIATALLILSAPATFVFNFWWMPSVRMRDDEWYRTAPQCERLLVRLPPERVDEVRYGGVVAHPSGVERGVMVRAEG